MKSLLILALLFQGADSGVITGRLLNLDGKPAANTRVGALAVRAPGDASGGALLAITVTDKDGQYRLDKIPPGRYYITAGLVSAPSYYPGTGNVSAAKEIQVLAGSIFDKMDFSMSVPDGVTVSGRLAMAPSIATTAKINLIEQGIGLQREETLRPDGTFEFQKVPPGQYMIQMPVGIPNQTLSVADRDITGLVLGNAGGVRVVGRLKMDGIGTNPVPVLSITLSGPPLISVLTAPPLGAAGGVISSAGALVQSQNLTARNNNDGSFEFLGVPPGTYSLRVLGPTVPIPTPIAIAEKDITGLEIPVPFQAEYTGKVVMADGTKVPSSILGVSVEARSPNGIGGAAIAPDGNFRLRLSKGDFQIGLRNLPLGFKIDSVTFKGDLLKTPLHIAPGQSGEIILTLASVPLDSIKGVRFSGRVTGMPTGNYTGGKLTLTGADSTANNIDTMLRQDGTFEFQKVPTGTYMPRVDGISNVITTSGPLQRIFIGNDDVSGFQIPLNIRLMVTGSVTVVDVDGHQRTDVTPSAGITFHRGNGTSGTSLRPDGTFQVPLEIGVQSISIDRLPPQFTVQTITAGSDDLLKSPLNVQFGAPLQVIQVRLLYKP